MKDYKSLALMMAIAIAGTAMTACSIDSNETEKPFTTCPVEHSKFFACESSGETSDVAAVIDTLFTEDDIEWFNANTREIRFKKQDEQLFNKLMMNYHKEGLEFRLGDSVLFGGWHFVADFDSRIFYDLVLHYSLIGKDEDTPRYYLHDCYPPQFIDDERTKANIRKNAPQWELFTDYLESKGKLRK